MEIRENVELSRYTTFRMGGVCKKLYVPQSTDELCELAKTLPAPVRYIGGGSNLLINDQKTFDEAVLLREFDDSIEHMGDGIFTVGASVRLQKLIKTVNSFGYGGIEYLYSVPALVGGAVYMNAGRGRSDGRCVSDFIESVTALHNGEMVTLGKSDCRFSYRDSVFKCGEYLILSVKFRFKQGTAEEFDAGIKERLEHCRVHQDSSKPNFGTAFCVADNRVMRLVCKMDKNAKGVHFSQKTRNWLLNDGGTFKQAMTRIKRVKRLHKLAFKKCKTEVVIWD